MLTLMGGFTTVQSVGSASDVSLRNAIAKGLLPGPRILTSVEPLMGQREKSGTSDEIRAYIHKQKSAGADMIKFFASAGGMLQGGMSLSQEQLNAACDEARKAGLRTLVPLNHDLMRRAAGKQIGSTAPGWQADIIGIEGNPVKDITAVRRVVFVMKSGIVYKNTGRRGRNPA